MSFYERYAKIAETYDLDPCSQKAADLFGVTKATISSWNVKSTTPKGETVAVIADKLGVSADYLLGRTEDPTDFAKQPAADEKATPVKRSAIPGVSSSFLLLYSQLDKEDKLKVEGVIQGLLMHKKYTAAFANAAHARTDVQITPDMIEHDEAIMDDDNF